MTSGATSIGVVAIVLTEFIGAVNHRLVIIQRFFNSFFPTGRCFDMRKNHLDKLNFLN